MYKIFFFLTWLVTLGACSQKAVQVPIFVFDSMPDVEYLSYPEFLNGDDMDGDKPSIILYNYDEKNHETQICEFAPLAKNFNSQTFYVKKIFGGISSPPKIEEYFKISNKLWRRVSFIEYQPIEVVNDMEAMSMDTIGVIDPVSFERTMYVIKHENWDDN